MMRIKFTIAVFLIPLLVISLSRSVVAAISLVQKPRNGVFLSLSGGYNEREDADDDYAKAMFDPGYLVATAIGYRFENLDNQVLKNIRIELEYSRQFNDVDKLHLHPPNTTIDQVEDAQGSSIDIESIQGGIFYDLPFKQIFSLDDKSYLSRITPYFGIELGFGRSILKHIASSTLVTAGGDSYPFSMTTDWVFAYTPKIGISYEINQRVDLFVAGRIYKSKKVTVIIDDVPTYPNIETWATEFGIRYNF